MNRHAGAYRTQAKGGSLQDSPFEIEEEKSKGSEASRTKTDGPTVEGGDYAPTCFSIQSIETDFGRVIAVPNARLRISCESIPSDRETPNSTV